MSFIKEHEGKFTELNYQLDHIDLLKRQANGGNAIIFSYPPEEEKLYIKEAKERFGQKAEFIDVSKLLVEFIDIFGWHDFADYYNDYEITPSKIFHSESSDPDLFKPIIKHICDIINDGKIPILIRTGCLYGSYIENASIVECRDVSNLPLPIVIFYPSSINNDYLYFLNFKKSNNYRCIIIK